MPARRHPVPGLRRRLGPRDFTFVGDVVRAFVAAGDHDTEPGTVVNVAGRTPVVLRDVFAAVESIAGRPLRLEVRQPEAGDVDRTGGSIDRIGELLGWCPEVPLADGLAAQFAWHESRR